MKNIKKFFVLGLAGMAIIATITGCGAKHECTWCGDETKCHSLVDEDGDKVYLCSDCYDEWKDIRSLFD